MRLVRAIFAALPLAVAASIFAAGPVGAQVQYTPNFSITPSAGATKWIIWMALGAGALIVAIILAVAVGYLRFAPKFFGREEAPTRPPPGARPQLLTRERPAVGATRPAVAQGSSARTATAVAERPAAPAGAAAPAAAATAPAAAATAPAASAPAAPAAAAAPPTASPEGEPAVQADVVGEAEARAPEASPTAKTAEEVGAAAAAPAPAPSAPAPSSPAATAPAAAAQSHGAAAALDQETFDRVLEEQLGKGVDRRVAEGRARAAAVVAARKKAQG